MADTVSERGQDVNDTLARVGSDLISVFEGRTEEITRSISDTGTLAAETISTHVKEVNDALKSNSDTLLVDLALRGQEINDKLDETGTRIAETITIRGGELADRLSRTGDRLQSALGRLIEARRSRVERVAAQLDALSPLRVLARGYSVAQDDTGRVLSRAADFPSGRPFRLRVSDGSVPARAE